MKKFMLGGMAAITLVTIATTAMAQPPRERGGPGRRGPGGPGRDSGPPMHPVLTALDADRDHELSEQEIDNAVTALKKLDKNDDGILSRDELRPQRRRGGPRGGPEFRGERNRGPESDRQESHGPRRRDNDRARRRPGQSPEQSAGRRGPGRPNGFRGPTVDRIMSQDADGDGKVSEEEMMARVRKMFNRADENQDGFVSRTEAEKMIPQFARGYGREDRRGDRGRDRPPRSKRPESE